jgi:hypothetical protein
MTNSMQLELIISFKINHTSNCNGLIMMLDFFLSCGRGESSPFIGSQDHKTNHK